MTHTQIPNSLQKTLLKRQTLVCCGAGGVGKTTTSAALALAGAQMGQNVLVLTIDPSKRLAQALGIEYNTPDPIQIDPKRLSAFNLPPSGRLSAWILDPKQVSNQVVYQEAQENADLLINNLIYKEISGMVAGMQEYTAVEALHRFTQSQEYDLIILDTPPARHALRFLDSPSRVASFLDKRIFRLFVPEKKGFIRKMASKVIDEVLDRAFGSENRKELKQFFELFSQLLDHLNQNQSQMKAYFQSDQVEFFLVTSSQSAVVEEALYFKEQVHDRHLHFGGFFLNRCSVVTHNTSVPSLHDVSDWLTPDSSTDLNQFYTVLNHLADLETRQTQADQSALDQLQKQGQVYPLPFLGPEAAELEGIAQLSTYLAQSIHS
jgi:anion-transporting  ArsA/GET3 family ATPase